MHAWVDYYNGSRSHILKTINDSDVLFPARPLPLSGIIHMGFLLDLGDIVNIHETNVVVAHLGKISLSFFLLVGDLFDLTAF